MKSQSKLEVSKKIRDYEIARDQVLKQIRREKENLGLQNCEKLKDRGRQKKAKNRKPRNTNQKSLKAGWKRIKKLQDHEIVRYPVSSTSKVNRPKQKTMLVRNEYKKRGPRNRQKLSPRTSRNEKDIIQSCSLIWNSYVLLIYKDIKSYQLM